MKLAVFGATGGTGKEIVVQALEAGHEVTVLVRDSTRLSVKHDKLYLVIGDAQPGKSGRSAGRLRSSLLLFGQHRQQSRFCGVGRHAKHH
ncbi:MAG: NAD(P)H-binding protein [Anaerolineaceae bacterium]|nr:NAD(P)H-binding protein [Anaerolineaceae bacterium]